MIETSAIELADLIRRREVSAEEAVLAALTRIEETNPELNAFVFIAEEDALASARDIDQKLARGRSIGVLGGVPFGVKDNLDCAGMPTRHGSAIYLENPPSPTDAPFVSRLRAAGAIPVGKTALPEFAMDSLTRSPAFGVTRNPWDPEMTPGGSSGGSAAAVAAGMVPFATGSDLGGSIRSPASMTGLIGFMPSHGRIPFVAPTDFDVLGPLTRSAADAARILDIASGPDRGDRHSIQSASSGFEGGLETQDLRGLRACWSGDLGFVTTDPEVEEIARLAVEDLCRNAGIELVERDFAPLNPYTTWIEIEAYEMAARLEATGLYPEHVSKMAPFTRQVIEEWVPDRLTWMRARNRREEIVAMTNDLFEEVDLLFTPTVACTAIPADGEIPDEIAGVDASESGAEPFTMLANMTWQPAISIPSGFTGGGLPVGLQAIARRFDESTLLGLAKVKEEAFPWPLTSRS